MSGWEAFRLCNYPCSSAAILFVQQSPYQQAAKYETCPLPRSSDYQKLAECYQRVHQYNKAIQFLKMSLTGKPDTDRYTYFDIGKNYSELRAESETGS